MVCVCVLKREIKHLTLLLIFKRKRRKETMKEGERKKERNVLLKISYFITSFQ